MTDSRAWITHRGLGGARLVRRLTSSHVGGHLSYRCYWEAETVSAKRQARHESEMPMLIGDRNGTNARLSTQAPASTLGPRSATSPRVSTVVLAKQIEARLDRGEQIDNHEY
jgi:hypothetical protein